MALNDALTRLKRGFKALFKGSRSKRNSNATTATKSKRQSQHIRFRNSDLAPLVNQDETLVQDDTLVQTSYVSDPGLHVASSPSAVIASQAPFQHRHSTALISHAHPDHGRGSPVSEMSRRTFPATSAPSPIDTAAANTMMEHKAEAADTTTDRHEVAATPVVAQEMSLPEQVQNSTDEGSATTHEVWRGGEDETLFIPGATLDEVGQHALQPLPEKEVLVEPQPPITVAASQADEGNATTEPTVATPETVEEPAMQPAIEEKGVNGQAVPLARETSSGAFPTMLATSGPLQDFYFIDTDPIKERYPGRTAC